MNIAKIAVIGSGVMGSGIAAQIANAGLPVVLLDIVPAKAADRSALAKGALEKMLKADPAPLMHPRNAKLITPGNLEDDLALLSDCDWIIEVVLEDLAVKHDLYSRIARYRKPGAILSSNTSTIPLHRLIEGQDEDFVRHFAITHFFNPPRYMRLLELVTGPKTAPDVTATLAQFCDAVLGKGVVRCHDTPGFIANRLGVFWLQAGLREALKYGIGIETADAVLSKPVGIPKTGVFGLIDLVGVDLMPHLAKSLLDTLPANDAYRDLYEDYGFIHGMIAAGYTGRKGKGGFYRLAVDEKGKKSKQALRLNADTFEEAQYAAEEKPDLAAVKAAKQGLRAVLTSDDAAGRYAWAVLSQTLAYAAALVPEIADNVAAVDEAMRLGYNWKHGPFEMIDALGADWFAARLEAEGKPVPALLRQVGAGSFYKVEQGRLHYFGTDGQYHPIARAPGVLLLCDLRLDRSPVYQTDSAALWDIGESVLCLEHTGKMNAVDNSVFEAIHHAVALIGDGKGKWKALVIYNEGPVFCAGANLALAQAAMKNQDWAAIDDLVSGGQKAYMALKYAPFPVVAAPSGMALGGGCEILLHADHVQAHAETYCGLVEVGVGLIPGWGGCKEMLLRSRAREQAASRKNTGGETLWMSPDTTPMGPVRMAFDIIAMARVAKSAADAQDIGYFRDSDGITMNRDRLLFDARAKALELAKAYQPPKPPEPLRLPGPNGRGALELALADLHKAGKATPYDLIVGGALALVLTGGVDGDWTKPQSEKDILRLEREEFAALVRHEGTLARITHMLDTGKPLRN